MASDVSSSPDTAQISETLKRSRIQIAVLRPFGFYGWPFGLPY